MSSLLSSSEGEESFKAPMPDCTNDSEEAAKCDKICDKIDHSVNLLTLNATAHLLAADYYYARYCALAIPSIALSSIVAVLGGILPSEMVEIVSALCNAMNTIALGLMALMRFESKSSLHTQGACTLQSLKVKQLELRDKLQQIVHGIHHEDSPEAANTFWRGWSETVGSLHAKAQETMEMTPIHPEFVAKAQAAHEFLFRAETQIPRIVVADPSDQKADRHWAPSAPRGRTERQQHWAPSPPPSPPGATRLPASPNVRRPRTAPPSIMGRLSRRQGRSTPLNKSTRKGPKWSFDETKIAGVEYSLQKLDQLRSRLRLMLSQHLIASRYYMLRYYALSFPSIALSSFLTVISLIIPKLAGCDALEDEGPAFPILSCPSENLGSLLNGGNTILLGVMAILRHQTKADMHDNAAKSLQSLIVTVEFLRDDMTYFSQRIRDETMVADGRTFFRGFSRRLGAVFAKVEEIQEMMPLHPSFQRKALTVHMDQFFKEQTLMSLHKISPQDMARAPRRRMSLFGAPAAGGGYGVSVSPR